MPAMPAAHQVGLAQGVSRCQHQSPDWNWQMPFYGCSTKTFARVLQVPVSSLDTSWDCTFWRYLWGNQAC